MNLRSWTLAVWISASVCIAGTAACEHEEGDSAAQAVRLQIYERPALVAFRDELNPEWMALPMGTSSSYELSVTGRYEIAIGCEGTGERPSFDLTVYGRTAEDGAALEHRCAGPPRPYRLRANVVKPADLSFGGSSRGSAASPWSFEISTEAGSFALITRHRPFSTGTPHIGIRRGIAITGDTDLGELDPSQEAVHALQPRGVVTLNKLPEEGLRWSVSLRAGGTSVSLLPLNHVGPVMLAPDDLLLPTDQQVLTVSASSPPDSTALSRGRSITQELRAGPPVLVTLPPPLEAVTIESAQHRTMVSWEDLPDHDVAVLSSHSLGNLLLPSRSHRLVVSRAFLAQGGANRLALDVRDLPGMKPEWLHDPALDLSESFGITRTADGEKRDSGVSKRTRASSEAAASTAFDN